MADTITESEKTGQKNFNLNRDGFSPGKSVIRRRAMIMPMLVCSAQRCVYNDGMYCSKGDILVGGETASTSGETSCTSFKERTSEGAKSSMGTPSQKIEVACEAVECMYNKNRVCDAGKIDISGTSASRSEQTECSTFRK